MSHVTASCASMSRRTGFCCILVSQFQFYQNEKAEEGRRGSPNFHHVHSHAGPTTFWTRRRVPAPPNQAPRERAGRSNLRSGARTAATSPALRVQVPRHHDAPCPPGGAPLQTWRRWLWLPAARGAATRDLPPRAAAAQDAPRGPASLPLAHGTAALAHGTAALALAHGTAALTLAHGTAALAVAHGTAALALAHGTAAPALAHCTAALALACGTAARASGRRPPPASPPAARSTGGPG